MSTWLAGRQKPVRDGQWTVREEAWTGVLVLGLPAMHVTRKSAGTKKVLPQQVCVPSVYAGQCHAAEAPEGRGERVLATWLAWQNRPISTTRTLF